MFVLCLCVSWLEKPKQIWPQSSEALNCDLCFQSCEYHECIKPSATTVGPVHHPTVSTVSRWWSWLFTAGLLFSSVMKDFFLLFSRFCSLFSVLHQDLDKSPVESYTVLLAAFFFYLGCRHVSGGCLTHSLCLHSSVSLMLDETARKRTIDRLHVECLHGCSSKKDTGNCYDWR